MCVVRQSKWRQKSLRCWPYPLCRGGPTGCCPHHHHHHHHGHCYHPHPHRHHINYQQQSIGTTGEHGASREETPGSCSTSSCVPKLTSSSSPSESLSSSSQSSSKLSSPVSPLLAPTGALVLMMVYYIFIQRPLFQIFTQSIALLVKVVNRVLKCTKSGQK